MINHGAARAAIGAVAAAEFESAGTEPEATVYTYPPTGAMRFPAVLVGLPEWDQTRHDLAAGYLDKTTFPVSVVVGRSGVDDAQAVADLEALWPRLINAINHEINQGTGFDGCCEAANLTRATFDPIQIGGQAYPAQTIEIDFYG